MANPISSSAHFPAVHHGKVAPARPSRQEEAIGPEREPVRLPRRTPEYLPGAEGMRRIEQQAEALSPSLHNVRDASELPRRSQEALATYRGILSASMAYDGGELVGLDIHV